MFPSVFVLSNVNTNLIKGNIDQLTYPHMGDKKGMQAVDQNSQRQKKKKHTHTQLLTCSVMAGFFFYHSPEMRFTLYTQELTICRHNKTKKIWQPVLETEHHYNQTAAGKLHSICSETESLVPSYSTWK